MSSDNGRKLNAGNGTLAALLAIACATFIPLSAYAACSPQDQKTFSDLLPPLMQSANADDGPRFVGLIQLLMSSVSPSCRAAIQSKINQTAPPSAGRVRPPLVNDHGGGNYSVPGVGACGPGGCVAF